MAPSTPRSGESEPTPSEPPESSEAVVADTVEDEPGAVAEPASSRSVVASQRHYRRRAASVVCALLSVLFALVGVSGLWIMRTAANEEWTQRQISATLRNPAVSDQLAATIVTEFAKAVDVDAKIRALLPPRLEGATPVLEQAARNLLEQRLSEAIRSDQAVDLAAGAVGVAQRQAVAVLSGERSLEGVNLENGQVQINLLPLIPALINAGHTIGLFKDVTAPDLRGKDRSQQLALLSEALNQELPEDFAQPVVFRSEAVAQAGATLNTVRTVLLWSRRLFWLLLIFAVGFGIGSIYLARNRSRAAIWLGGGYLAGFLLTRLIVGQALAQLPSVIVNPGGTAAIDQIADNAVSSLTGWYVVFGLIIAGGLGATYLLTRSGRSRAMSATL